MQTKCQNIQISNKTLYQLLIDNDLLYTNNTIKNIYYPELENLLLLQFDNNKYIITNEIGKIYITNNTNYYENGTKLLNNMNAI